MSQAEWMEPIVPKSSIDSILPYGAILRPLLNPSNGLGNSDIKKLLLKKGIFIGRNDKDVISSILLCSLLSPKEFEFLQERQKSKEDKIKYKTDHIQWDGNNITIDEALETIHIEENQITPEGTSYSLVGGLPAHTIEDNKGDEVHFDFTVIRTDVSKEWCRTDPTFPGKLIIKKGGDGKTLDIITQHTSEETKEISENLKNTIVSQFKLRQYIQPSAKLETISFSSFTNKNRLLLMLGFHDVTTAGTLVFKNVTGLEMGIDPTQPLPEKINWMKDRVNQLIFSGKYLQKAEYFELEEYHDCIIVESIQATFEYHFRGIKGTCEIEYGFPKCLSGRRKQEIEFQVNLGRITKADQSLKAVEQFILAKFDQIKHELYIKYKNP